MGQWKPKPTKRLDRKINTRGRKAQKFQERRMEIAYQAGNNGVYNHRSIAKHSGKKIYYDPWGEHTEATARLTKNAKGQINNQYNKNVRAERKKQSNYAKQQFNKRLNSNVNRLSGRQRTKMMSKDQRGMLKTKDRQDDTHISNLRDGDRHWRTGKKELFSVGKSNKSLKYGLEWGTTDKQKAAYAQELKKRKAKRMNRNQK